VKKKMVIESFESNRESFARVGVRMLRGGGCSSAKKAGG
jgi:hypothetical protein